MATISNAAHMARLAYAPVVRDSSGNFAFAKFLDQTEFATKLPGWRIDSVIDHTATGGDYELVFVNDSTKEIGISSRGTTSWGGPDGAADWGIIHGQSPDQTNTVTRYPFPR